MDMIAFSVELNQLGIELVEDMKKNFFQGRQSLGIKYMLSVFGNKHQMNVHFKHTMSTGSDVRIFFHSAFLTILQGQ